MQTLVSNVVSMFIEDDRSGAEFVKTGGSREIRLRAKVAQQEHQIDLGCILFIYLLFI